MGDASYAGRVCPAAHDETCAVGRFQQGASPFGALDMAGNVAEWTATEWAIDGKPLRVIRGGGTFDAAQAKEGTDVLHTTYRTGVDPNTRYGSIGFRCAK